MTFKDVKCEDWETAYDLIYRILRNEFERHSELLTSDKISSYEKQYLTSVLNDEANENDVACAFLNLSRLLHIHYGVAPMIIIDEYDTSIQQVHVRGYYDKVIDFMRTLFSGGLKDNPHLSYGFLTGILRVAKESIFSGLNNIKVNSVLDNRYSEYFGFTSEEVYEKLESLMQGKSFVTHIDTGVIYLQLQNNPSSIYSFLLVTGYLKAVTNDQPFGGDYMCEVALPNKEISYVCSKEILSKFENVISPAATTAIQEAIYTMDIPKLQNKLETFLLQTISFYDTANETFYHDLILGLCAMLDNHYHITSNREAGNGRFDIQMLPLNKKLPGILIELKAGKNCTEEQLNELAETALEQINDRKYRVEMCA